MIWHWSKYHHHPTLITSNKNDNNRQIHHSTISMPETQVAFTLQPKSVRTRLKVGPDQIGLWWNDGVLRVPRRLRTMKASPPPIKIIGCGTIYWQVQVNFGCSENLTCFQRPSELVFALSRTLVGVQLGLPGARHEGAAPTLSCFSISSLFICCISYSFFCCSSSAAWEQVDTAQYVRGETNPA